MARRKRALEQRKVYGGNKKRDNSEKEVLPIIEHLHIQYQELNDHRFPDTCFAYNGRSFLIEFKTGDEQLNDDQRLLHDTWDGHMEVARNDDDVYRIIGFGEWDNTRQSLLMIPYSICYQYIGLSLCLPHNRDLREALLEQLSRLEQGKRFTLATWNETILHEYRAIPMRLGKMLDLWNRYLKAIRVGHAMIPNPSEEMAGEAFRVLAAFDEMLETQLQAEREYRMHIERLKHSYQLFEALTEIHKRF